MINRADLKQQAKQQMSGNIGTLIGCALVVYAASVLVACIPYVGSIIVTIGTPCLVLGITGIYINLTKGVVPQLGDVFKETSRWLPAFILNILMSIFIFLWSLLLFVPGIIKGISYSMSYYILSENPEMTAMEALNESKRMMDGWT